MGKVVDITDKLDFQGNPVMQIGDLEVEVNADAETVLRLIGVFSDKSELAAVGEAMNMIFREEDVKKICSMKKNGKKLTGKSLVTIVEEAVGLVMGEDSGE